MGSFPTHWGFFFPAPTSDSWKSSPVLWFKVRSFILSKIPSYWICCRRRGYFFFFRNEKNSVVKVGQVGSLFWNSWEKGCRIRKRPNCCWRNRGCFGSWSKGGRAECRWNAFLDLPRSMEIDLGKIPRPRVWFWFCFHSYQGRRPPNQRGGLCLLFLLEMLVFL